MIIKQLLMSEGFYVLNKKIVQKLGIETAFLLSAFAECEKLLGDEEGWFFQTIERIEELTTLSRKKQDKILKKLIDLKFLERENRGVPCKRFFRLNYDIISNFIFSEEIRKENIEQERDKLDCPKGTNWIVQKGQTRLCEKDKLDCAKGTNYYKENNINNINKEINNKYHDHEYHDYFEKIFKEIGVNYTTTNQNSVKKLLKTMKKEDVRCYIIELYNNLSKIKTVNNLPALLSQKLANGERQLSKTQINEIKTKEHRKKENSSDVIAKFLKLDEYEKLKIEEEALRIMNFTSNEIFIIRQNNYPEYLRLIKIGLIQAMQQGRFL